MQRRGVGDFTRQQTVDALDGTALGRAMRAATVAAATPEGAKAAGMARAYANSAEWRQDATPRLRDVLLGYPDGAELTTDQLTPRLPALTVEQRKAWPGALIGTVAKPKWGWLTWTGRFDESERRSLHGSPLRVWRVNRAAVARGIPEKERVA